MQISQRAKSLLWPVSFVDSLIYHYFHKAAQPREEETETMHLMKKRKELQEAERALAEERVCAVD